jgi:Zn-dependent membrane protease YugP
MHSPFLFGPGYFEYLMFIGPALLLGLWAQLRIHTTYAAAQQQPAPLSGAAAARHILDSAGLTNVQIEEVPGHLTDHYDPRDKVLRLSQEVYESRTLAAVGIAAHEAGHALQDAYAYAPLAVRNAAVPVANIGSSAGIIMIIVGAALLHNQMLIWCGIILFAGVVAFQVVNLPVEFNASNRAKAQLVQLGIIDEEQLGYVKSVLGAAAMTYVAATLQAILTLLYYVMRYGGSGNDRD